MHAARGGHHGVSLFYVLDAGPARVAGRASIGWLTQKRNRPSVAGTGTFAFAALISKRRKRIWKAVAAQHFSQNERLLAMTRFVATVLSNRNKKIARDPLSRTGKRREETPHESKVWPVPASIFACGVRARRAGRWPIQPGAIAGSDVRA
jgi:hypothetical protein